VVFSNGGTISPLLKETEARLFQIPAWPWALWRNEIYVIHDKHEYGDIHLVYTDGVTEAMNPAGSSGKSV
jgi:hypothetical protein